MRTGDKRAARQLVTAYASPEAMEAALKARGMAPCCIREWMNEPKRREVLMRKRFAPKKVCEPSTIVTFRDQPGHPPLIFGYQRWLHPTKGWRIDRCKKTTREARAAYA